MLMFPSEMPAALQEESAPKKEEKMTETDFLDMLTDLDNEFTQKEPVVVAEKQPEPPKKKKWIEEAEEPPAKKKLMRPDVSLMLKKAVLTKTKKAEAIKTKKAEPPKTAPPMISPEPPKIPPKDKEVQTKEEGVINMSVYFSQQMKQGSSAHKALMSMLQ